jgi:hypothetical protein
VKKSRSAKTTGATFLVQTYTVSNKNKHSDVTNGVTSHLEFDVLVKQPVLDIAQLVVSLFVILS